MRTFVTAVLVLCVVGLVNAGTVSGPITSDTVWNTPVTVTGNVTVLLGHTLTIQPGVTVQFNSGTALLVAGAIVANGTIGNPITFTSSAGSPTPGSWNGIEFQSTTNVSSVFNYCIVEYAGGGTDDAGVFYITGAYSISISNCTFQFNSGNGVNTRASSPRISTTLFTHNGGFGVYSDLLSNFTIDSCTIVNNTNGGIHVSQNANSTTQITNCLIDTNGTGIYIDNSAFPTIKNDNIRANGIGIQFTAVGSNQPAISGNTISGNTSYGFFNSGTSLVKAERNYWGSTQGPFQPSLNPTGTGNKVSDYVDFQPWSYIGISLPSLAINANIAGNTVWSPGTVYWIKSNIAVNNGVVLTIYPGTIVKFAPNTQLQINGAIVANGKPDSLIIFTSDKDDSYGGDTNGDTTATGPNPGDWSTLYMPGGQNSASALTYCVFKFGGQYGNPNIYVTSASPTLSNIYSTNSSNYGLILSYSSSNLSNSVFAGNGYRGLYFTNTNSTLTNLTVLSNGNIGLLADGTSRLIIHKVSVSKNGSTGINVDGGTGSNATIVLIDSSIITNNSGNGIYSWAGTGPQSFSYNRISGNQGVGLWCWNMNDTVHITGDTVQNNAGEGMVTSRGVILNNTIQGNRYPIGLVGRVNSTYSGNVITGNQYNNALALRMNRGEESFTDTLKTTFPAGITSGTYVLIENAPSQGVPTGQTLLIQPGAIIKMAPGLFFNAYGTLIANGTSAKPIVFTSWRDGSYGGKTNLVSDTLPPAPGDWQYLQFVNGSSIASVFRNCILKYGGEYGNGIIYVGGSASLTNPLDSLIVRRSGSQGIIVYNSIITITNSLIDSCGNAGIYIQGGSPRADVTVRGSTIQYNNATGLYSPDVSTFREVSNCIIAHNNGNGVYVNNGSITQVFEGNTISFNNGHGIYNQSPAIPAASVQFIGNHITDNWYEAVFSSAATFIDNTFQRNRYPLGVFGHLGNIYVDNNNVDGNVFQNNQFNNAIALAGYNYAPLSDTLKNLFPVAITSGTYVDIENIQVNNGATLVIQQGVTVKFQTFPPYFNDYKQFNVYGTIKAVGTPGSPIIFTSWRDSTFGGKTNSPTEHVSPAPGDWYFFALRNGSGGSIVRNCQFRYGGRDGQQTIYFEQNLGGMTFSNNLIRKSYGSGMIVANTVLYIDSTRVDSCNGYGLWLSDNVNNNVALTNSQFINNGNYGVFGQGNANFSVISKCVIKGNNATGLYIQNNTIPLTVVSNTVSNNNGHGIYVIARNDLKDTILTIAGNKVMNNVYAGIFSSRALMFDDTVTGNRYGIGVTGQISLDGSSTNAGNYYQGGLVSGNLFNSVLVAEANVFGRLGLSFPPNDTGHVVAIRGDLTVPNGDTLSIKAGTVIKFPHEWGNARFEVDGVLKCEGTNNNKIVFTSWRDDTYGGDSNADTNATLPGPGNWDMVYLYNSSNNGSHILQTMMRYGGLSGNGNLDLYNNSAPIDSSFFSYSSNYGIYLNSASPLITGNEIHHNPTGVLAGGSANPILRRNNFHDNSSWGLNNNTSNTIDAQFNWWNAASGPFVNQGAPQNLSGTGEHIGINPGEVNFLNWLTSRTGVLLGDVSGNASITAYDASLILQYLVSSITLGSSQLAAADVTGDGTVSALDASYILRYVVGLLTGFPGLGKSSANSAIASAYDLKVEKSQSDGEFDLIIHLNGGTAIYASELKVEFDGNAVSFVSMSKTSMSDSISVFNSTSQGKAAMALASIYPISEQRDLVKFTFKAKNAINPDWTTSLHIAKFVLNEVNLTQSTKDIEVNTITLKGIPTKFDLSQNYPNPFNPSTTIQYQLPTTGNVSIKIYDMLGREVATLMDRPQEAGYYSIVWNGRNAHGQTVASGVYLYRIQANSSDQHTFTSTKRMLLLK
jgi:parallel beta-helix repeat protein